ncbi:uncharacterized protein [Drosophila kikkawai]|uniref:Uncharacterized protein isoform X2 n=1 Tax=Drosophila kikkawai TaxID=30033 RepID=A0A6P4JFF1_DROKI|nr:uncharacterized protein LOC108083114 isoform X3 [Drosophila kikkawai]
MLCLKHFCWCLSLGIGCIVISIFTLFHGFLNMMEFFRLREYHDITEASVWPNLLWGTLHLIASMCLSYSVLKTAINPILVYAIIEACYLIYALIYGSVSCALKTNIYAKLNLTNGILFWIYVVLVCEGSDLFI